MERNVERRRDENERGSSRRRKISIQVDVTEIETRIRYPERSTNRIEIRIWSDENGWKIKYVPVTMDR